MFEGSGFQIQGLGSKSLVHPGIRIPTNHCFDPRAPNEPGAFLGRHVGVGGCAGRREHEVPLPSQLRGRADLVAKHPEDELTATLTNGSWANVKIAGLIKDEEDKKKLGELLVWPEHRAGTDLNVLDGDEPNAESAAIRRTPSKKAPAAAALNSPTTSQHSVTPPKRPRREI